MSDVMKVDPAAKLPGVAVHALLTVLTVLTKITPKMHRTSDCFTAGFAHLAARQKSSRLESIPRSRDLPDPGR